MKQLGIAFLLLLATVAVVFFILDAALLDADFDNSVYEKGIPLAIASFALLATPYLHQAISGRRKRFSFTSLPDTVVPFDDYLLPWQLLLLYGTLFLYVVSGLAIIIVWLAGEATGLYITRLISGLNFLFLAVAAFLVGSWIGTRAQRRSFLISSGVVLAYMLLAALTTWLVRSSFNLIPLIVTAVPYLLIALAGTWAGRRRRIANYVRYLLAFVPPQERVAVADAVYQKALALSPVDTPRRFTANARHTVKEHV